jgi:predicted membrane protein
MRGSMVRSGQRGASRLKVILWLAIFVSMMYVGIRVVPILYSEYLFQDAMQNTARFASVNRQTVEDIRASLLKEAKSEDIPVRPEDIHVESEAGNVRISASYSVTVDLQVYQWTLNFNPTANNNAI